MIRRSPIWTAAGMAATLIAIQVAATAVGREFYLTQLTMSAYYAIVAMGLSMVMGYAGQVSLGHAAFFAIGGYASAWLTTTAVPLPDGAPVVAWLQRAGVLAARPGLYGGTIVTATPGAACLAAVAAAAAVAILVGFPALRLKGHYLAMATLGFGLIVYRIVLGSPALGAADGITGVPEWRLPGGLVIGQDRDCRVQNYYVAWTLTLVVLLLLMNLVRSRVGRALRSIHDGELAANAMGVNTAAYKLKVFVLSAVLAAVAGSVFTHYTGGIGPSEAGAMKSVRYVSLVAAGGMANLPGVLAVSTILNYLSLRGCFGSFDSAVFGVLLIAIVALAPDGPFKPFGTWLARRRARAAAPSTEGRP